MIKILPTFVIASVLVITGWLLWGSIDPDARPPLSRATSTIATTTEKEPVAYECDGDGKICPDGSVVGRTGAKCEFIACPPPTEKSGAIHTTIGQRMTALNVTITPHDVVDDSRCPADVQCIWAGTAHVRATVVTPAGTSEEMFELGKGMTVGEHTITLTGLTPAPQAGETIPDSSYRFSFMVERP
ncbi:MAG: hypothetical protein KBD06_02160 [Candidatus Pacebacteria bacterium]|nr:hypothetical protein [Candidatus Paceibacterota bacterium]